MTPHLRRASDSLRDAVKSSGELVRTLRNSCAKLVENDAYRLLLHPEVLLHSARFRREVNAQPLLMEQTPSSVEIELTNRCNLACIQCLRSQGLKPYELGDMRLEDYQRILAQFPRLLSVCLNGFGEPLMHPRFAEIVAYTRGVLPWAKIMIYSNGTLLTKELGDDLIGAGLTEVNVSIDAATPETYRKVRRGGRFDLVHENLRELLRRRRERKAKLPLVGVNFVMLNDNEGELVPFIEQAAELGVDYVNCITYATYDWGFENLRSPASYRAELARARARLDELELKCRSFPSDDLSWAEPGHPFACNFFWGQSFRVTWDGSVTLGCCTPFKETYSYGNLLETPLAELWNGPAFRENRGLAREGRPPNAVCARCQEQTQAFFAPRDAQLVSIRKRRA
jgi:MoaA/NifB/PqqE/SkfB family radical SAM enzyme